MLAGSMCHKFEEKISTEEPVMSPNGINILDGAIPLPSNSEEVSEKNTQPKYTFQELNFNLFHNQDSLNTDTCKRHQYQIHDKFETSAHYASETADIVRQNSRRFHQNPQKYETKLILKQSCLLSQENEENQSPQYLNYDDIYVNHLQNQCTEYIRVESGPFQNDEGACCQSDQDVDSFDNVDDAIMLQEDGRGSRQQVAVDDIKSTPLSQEDDSADDLFFSAEAFDRKAAGAEGEFLQTQLPVSPHGLGEFLQIDQRLSNSGTPPRGRCWSSGGR
jgi:hypothetical protein